tara:strand:- start:2752 stop:2979 length:228 start_codon:yes stop_codon:yes gene_type:complete
MAKRQVVKEFLGSIVKAIGKRKGKAAARQFLQSPGMRKLAQHSAKVADDIRSEMEKDAKAGDKRAQQLLDLDIWD